MDYLDSYTSYIEASKCIDRLVEAGNIGENEGAMYLGDWVRIRLEELFYRDYLETEEGFKSLESDCTYEEYKELLWEEFSYSYEVGVISI